MNTLKSLLTATFIVAISIVAVGQQNPNSPWKEVQQKNVVKTNQQGNVGVGTAQPEAKLHISGGRLRVDSMSGEGNRLVFVDKNGILKTVPLSVISREIYATPKGTYQGPPDNATNSCYQIVANDPENFSSGSTSSCNPQWRKNGCHMYMCPQYNLGVGITTPGAKAEFRAGGFENSISKIFLLSHGSFDNPLFKFSAVDGKGASLSMTDGTNEQVAINADGNSYFKGGKVGIGTNDPQASLEVHHGVLKISGGAGLSQDNARFVMDMGASHAHRFLEFRNDHYGKVFVVTGNGNVFARKIKVTLSSPLGDFVFEEDYDLMTLHNLEKFIKENHHLPGIPSAKEVDEEGLDLGEMQAKQLQKIEELTLYVIEQQKMIEELRVQLEELKSDSGSNSTKTE